MPELPEVETMVRGIREFVEGRRIVELRACECACKPITQSPSQVSMAERVVGLRVSAVRRRAKRCVLELENGEALVIEPRMTGLLLLKDPPDQGHLRLECRFAGRKRHNSLWFWDRRGLGTVRLHSPEEMRELWSEGKLGRDALEMTAADWMKQCATTSREIKVALLDQKVAAGIGNLYASEILHRARIHPSQPANQLTRRQQARLAEMVLLVLGEAIEKEGSTLGDGTYRNALNQAGRYQNEHQVYQRTDEECRSCGRGRIQRMVQAQRATFFCPACQKLAK